MTRNDDLYYDELRDDDVISVPFCGVCDTRLVPKTDLRHPEAIWLTCPECKKALEFNDFLEEKLKSIEEKWLRVEGLYRELQDHFNATNL